MKFKLIFKVTIYMVMCTLMCSNTLAIDPVTPNASPEARALLKYLSGLSGKYILSGQHNFPASGERNTQFAADYIGKTPVVWSQDFGFSAAGDKDSYLSRPAIIQEAIRQHKKGAIIAFCWHAAPPTADEPVTFQPLPGKDPAAPLASVQGRLTDKQFHDILTPGTPLYKQWVKQVDVIASYLKQLQDARVPVLWRPYHEMNGDWFWWGGRTEGKYTTAALYRQLFDRLVRFHKLNNLIWIWSVDRPSRPGREFVKYYPGTRYLDILAIDIYGNDFNQSYYDGLKTLSEGKPVTLGEVGNPPSTEILEKQPDWIYWIVWSGMARGTSQSDYSKLAANAHVLFFEDEAYINGIKEYRASCGFEPVKLNRSADFTGEWRLNEC
jgi:mannan endo-1,4-beta-mannosidase